MAPYQHSVSLNSEKCRGCTHCLKHCPTEAIRIREGHAVIDAARCVDCGQCIRYCPHQAKKAAYDKLVDIPKEKWKIALPAPSLFGQFDNLDDIDHVIQGLYNCGFDQVYEVARAAELVSDYTRKYMKEKNPPHPVISSACPVVERLIMLRYPYLVDHLLPILPPIEVAAKEAIREAMEKNPKLSREDICVAFISPCPAKVSYVKNKTLDKKSNVDLVISVSDIYFELLGVMKKNEEPTEASQTGRIGLGWASSGGEATAIFNEKYLAADGIENVVHVLEEVDNGAFPELEFIELNACSGGCVGGVMNVVNPFIAKARLRSLRRYLPVSQNWGDEASNTVPSEMLLNYEFQYESVSSFGSDREESMRMMSQMEEIFKGLPGIDCGSCGAPTCRAFAADIVRGRASIEDCPPMLRGRKKRGGEKTT
ncbi:MAG: 4Fe-4S dicluster domain-containing protein [Ruminococcaceae bacterium]|nr:4Fe-4S dicluster domain-containing protein [Oscillospiraceae bacterium]